MKNIKDITLSIFAVIGFVALLSSFTNQPQSDNEVVILKLMGKKLESAYIIDNGDEYNQALVQVKSVDQNYPLIGEVIIEPDISIKEALKKNGSNYGILVENNLLNQLNLKVGSNLNLGKSVYNIRGTI